MMKFSKRDSKKMIKEMARLYGLSVSEVREQIQDKIIAVMDSDDPDQQAEFKRITYITTALGYSSCTQELISEHLELACKEAERTDREFDILKDYPEYFKDENVYEQIDEWIEDFISQAPPAKRDEIRQLIKENTEII